MLAPGTDQVNRSTLADNATVILNGAGNVVHGTARADIAVFLGPNELWTEPGTDVTDNAAIPSVVNVCPTMVYDTSNAPSPGC